MKIQNINPTGNNFLLELPTPKQKRSKKKPRDLIYPFYAGFSRDFARSIIDQLSVIGCESIIDPWNGSGTVTLAASTGGLFGSGTDINPVMVLAAKSKLVTKGRAVSAIQQAIRSLHAIRSFSTDINEFDDPLGQWFDTTTVALLRAIVEILGLPQIQTLSQSALDVSNVKALVAVTLFRTVRKLLRPFLTTNPTWIKRAGEEVSKISISSSSLNEAFQETGSEVCSLIAGEPLGHAIPARISLASSTALPFKSSSFDACLTSPPYCTRIDYVVATMPEIALISKSLELASTLRSTMLGTIVVPEDVSYRSMNWGRTCNDILDQVLSHPSKASSTYYFKTLVGYFSRLYNSLREIARVLRIGGTSIIVAQGSYYKDILVDLPKVIQEMFRSLGLEETESLGFKSEQNFSTIHKNRIVNRRDLNVPEVVLWFSKTEHPSRQ